MQMIIEARLVDDRGESSTANSAAGGADTTAVAKACTRSPMGCLPDAPDCVAPSLARAPSRWSKTSGARTTTSKFP
jgi:hypothetical protein